MDEIKKIAIIGSGIMGSGITYALVRADKQVCVADVKPEIVHANLSRLFLDPLRRRVQSLEERMQNEPEKKEQLEQQHAKAEEQLHQAEEKMQRMVAQNLEEAVKDAELVIEAVPENMRLKKKIFANIDRYAPKKCIFATNTSCLSISEIASSTNRPKLVLGLHFFNPAPLMRLVEVIYGKETSEETLNKGIEFVKSIKKVPIKVRDSPGFIVNRILVPMMVDALYELESRPDLARVIDNAMKKLGIMPMGPYELSDLIGLDTALDVAKNMSAALGKAYEPSRLLKKLVDANHLGRKSKAGIYFYDERKDSPPEILGIKHFVKPDEQSYDVLRLIAPMVNEALYLLQQGIVDSVEELHDAMRYGGNWKKGPIDMLKEFGSKQITDRLALLQKERPNCAERYAACSLLENPSQHENLNAYLKKQEVKKNGKNG